MSNDYSSEAEAVANSIEAVYENKQVNKVNDISGDFSSDNVSYPTAKAVKSELSGYVTTTVLNTILASYVTSSALDTLLALKVNITDIVDNLTSTDVNKPLSANQGKVLKDAIDSVSTDAVVTISKQATAEDGYASTYVLYQGGTALSPKINIEKDRMLRSISVETVGATPTAEESEYGMVTGDQYILMIVDTTSSDNPTRIILPISDVFDLQSADETTLTLSNGVFSIKTAGVGTVQLSDGAVTTVKIADSNVTYAKLAASAISTLEDTMDSKISDFASQLADAINPE